MMIQVKTTHLPKPLILVAVMLTVAGCNQQSTSEQVISEQVANKQADNPPQAVVADIAKQTTIGQQRYESSCKMCHNEGLLNAPKIGDQVAWQTRLSKGKSVLYKHAIYGFGKMPAQAVGDVSPNEVEQAVDYLIASSQ